jgi:4-hydroxyphenylacetate 3-monooxygenase
MELIDERGVRVDFAPEAFIIAGYTGRDRASVQAHIDELAHQGIAPPPSVPMWYEMPPALLTTAAAIDVPTAETCGEVEPVLIGIDGVLYLGIGSDHTARDVEKEDIATSKRICPKPIGTTVARIAALDDAVDALQLESAIDGEPYQSGTLAQIVSLATLHAGLLERTGARQYALFCGTVPLLTHAFRFGTHFTAQIRGGFLTAPLTLSYDVAGVVVP